MTSERGFTLLEVTIALAVVAITAGLVLPRLADLGALRVTTAARRLAGDLTLARDRAILGGRPVRLVVDVDRGAWWSEPALVRGTAPAGVRIGGVRGGDADGGRTTIVLSPGGDARPVRVDLRDDRGHAAQVVVPAGPQRIAAVEVAR